MKREGCRRWFSSALRWQQAVVLRNHAALARGRYRPLGGEQAAGVRPGEKHGRHKSCSDFARLLAASVDSHLEISSPRSEGWTSMSAGARLISLQLVDPSDGRTLQAWGFDSHRITIGRDDAADIPLADPYVSRIHAEIVHDDGSGWRLLARGRNGVFMDGRSVAECELAAGATFRLGATGPMFRFGEPAEQRPEATLSFDPDAVILLSLNAQVVNRQADEITATDYFQQLQRKARELREQRSGS
jgi:hypothetical protein